MEGRCRWVLDLGKRSGLGGHGERDSAGPWVSNREAQSGYFEAAMEVGKEKAEVGL